jgi:cytochrome c553
MKTRAGFLVAGAFGLVNGLAAPAPASDATPAFKQLDSIEARVQGCVTCHGQDGQGTNDGAYPRIAGKPAGYLYDQLTAFRDGERTYPPMNYLVAYLPDDYLREIADYFSRQKPAFAPLVAGNASPQALARGQQLATEGDAGLGVPACVACHGKGLAGMEPGIPGLVGLRSNYIAGQLTRWRVGERRAADPDCMRRIAVRLKDPDVTALAAWLSAQAPPKDPSPEPANAGRMPFACGSPK